MKDNDKLPRNAYRHFRQEVKREIRLAEKEHVRSEILKSNGNTKFSIDGRKGDFGNFFYFFHWKPLITTLHIT